MRVAEEYRPAKDIAKLVPLTAMGHRDATAVTSKQDTSSFYEGQSAEQVFVDMEPRFSDDYTYSLRLIPLRTTPMSPSLCMREEPSIPHGIAADQLPRSILKRNGPHFKTNMSRVHFADQALDEARESMAKECESYYQKNQAQPMHLHNEALDEVCESMTKECESYYQKNQAQPMHLSTFVDALKHL
ncbi:MAG: uncharacterized protein KVP18_000647 [Porospora cf. gigantea A]|uniref:uncharacterized protein n=1 Tax=Porospora cf. gigantea A TaxID=2853593 RepID=UPI0035597326|nr:MAG: hypothetical protein KVP18_000647 [Porospora cf. gigantea A]